MKMDAVTRTDYEKAIAFWNDAYKPIMEEEPEITDLKDIAPSEKLYEACASLGTSQNVLDYGCGHGWGAVIIASCGCKSVTAVDVNANAAEAAKRYAEAYGLQNQIETACVSDDWICTQADNSYDAFFCSNVLDVVPEEVSDRILENAARILKPGGKAVIGMNHYLKPEENPQRGITVKKDNQIFINGILRLVSKTDEEWINDISAHFRVDRLLYFAWPNEEKERRRLFYLTAE